MMFVTKTAEQGALYGYRTGHSERGTTGELQHRRISDNVSQAIAQAVADNTTIDLTDDKGRRIIVPAKHSVTRSSAPKPSTPSASARCDHESRISGLGHYLKAAFVLLNHRYSGSTPR